MIIMVMTNGVSEMLCPSAVLSGCHTEVVLVALTCPPPSLFDPQYGFNMVMSHPHAVNEIALSLNNKNPR